MQRLFLAVLALQATATVHAFQSTPLARTQPSRQQRLDHVMAPRAAVSDLMSELDYAWQTYPYTAAAFICGFKASCADIVAQVQEFNKEEEEEELGGSSSPVLKSTQMLTATAAVDAAETEEKESFSFLSSNDWKRTGAFLAYGALYQGITQEYFFNHLYPVWFGTGTGLETVATKVAFTLLVQTTLLTLPSLYASKALIEGFPLKEAAQQYIYDIQYQGLLQKFYVLWGPVLSLTFSVIPEHLRVTFVAVVSFFWLIILSSISGSDREEA